MNGITFDKESHRYFKDGKPVLSVTQYLKLAGFVDCEWFTDEGRARGSAVHAAMNYLVQNDLDESSIHPVIMPYIEAGKKFIAETGFKPEKVEQIVYDEIYGYIGTYDAKGTWDLSPGKIRIDYKTGSLAPYVGLQLAAYDAADDESCRKFAVELKGDGTYRLSKEYNDRNDIKVFRALVSTVNWRIKNGLLVPDEALAA